jgi:hypothetical protein
MKKLILALFFFISQNVSFTQSKLPYGLEAMVNGHFNKRKSGIHSILAIDTNKVVKNDTADFQWNMAGITIGMQGSLMREGQLNKHPKFFIGDYFGAEIGIGYGKFYQKSDYIFPVRISLGVCSGYEVKKNILSLGFKGLIWGGTYYDNLFDIGEYTNRRKLMVEATAVILNNLQISVNYNPERRSLKLFNYVHEKFGGELRYTFPKLDYFSTIRVAANWTNPKLPKKQDFINYNSVSNYSEFNLQLGFILEI